MCAPAYSAVFVATLVSNGLCFLLTCCSDNEGSESSTSRGVSTDSEADFEVEFKENPQLQKVS